MIEQISEKVMHYWYLFSAKEDTKKIKKIEKMPEEFGAKAIEPIEHSPPERATDKDHRERTGLENT